MRILLANDAFHTVGGSETYLLTLAEQLLRLGHDVRIYARLAGDMASLARERGIDVHTELADLGEPADVVLSQDSHLAYVLAEHWPQVPQVFVCHSSLFDFQQPPLLPGAVGAVVVMNDRVRHRMAALNADLRVVRLTQPIDTDRLIPRGSPHPEPRRALVLSNYLDGPALELLTETWGETGVEVVQLGTPSGRTMLPEAEIAAADIVVGKGRSVLDAMACGRPAYVYDVLGADGWVTPDSYPGLEADGITGQLTGGSVQPERLRADLAAYDPIMGQDNRNLVLHHHQARAHAHSVLDLLQEVAPDARTGLSPNGELARMARLRWAAEAELFGLRHEFGNLARDHAEAEAEVVRKQAQIDYLTRLEGELREVEATLRATIEEINASADGAHAVIASQGEEITRLRGALTASKEKVERAKQRTEQARSERDVLRAELDALPEPRAGRSPLRHLRQRSE